VITRSARRDEATETALVSPDEMLDDEMEELLDDLAAEVAEGWGGICACCGYPC
jgi:hypothetical protein